MKHKLVITYAVVDVRDEIRTFEKQFRLWPRSGSVSKPWDNSPNAWDDMFRSRGGWTADDFFRRDQEHVQEQFYKRHRIEPILPGANSIFKRIVS